MNSTKDQWPHKKKPNGPSETRGLVQNFLDLACGDQNERGRVAERFGQLSQGIRIEGRLKPAKKPNPPVGGNKLHWHFGFDLRLLPIAFCALKRVLFGVFWWNLQWAREPYESQIQTGPCTTHNQQQKPFAVWQVRISSSLPATVITFAQVSSHQCLQLTPSLTDFIVTQQLVWDV